MEVIVQCVTDRGDEYEITAIKGVPVDLDIQDNRDTLEMVFTDAFQTSNLNHVRIEEKESGEETKLYTIEEARKYLRMVADREK